jgi:hypothetical protein
MKLVMRAARQAAGWRAWLVSPLVAATVFAWTLAVVVGDRGARGA